MAMNNNTVTFGDVKTVFIKKMIELMSDSTIPLFQENVRQDTPEGGYMDLLFFGSGTSIKIASGTYSKTAIMSLETYTPLGEGSGLSDSILELVVGDFQDVVFLDNVLNVNSVSQVVDGVAGSFWQTSILITYTYQSESQ